MSSSLFDVIDFEASSLRPNSYPIEVGWTRGNEVHSYLIRPYAIWTDWDDYAETQIHHISREQLMDEGLPADEVMELLNASLGTDIVWCDGGEYDRGWLNVLQRDSGVKATFGLGSIQTLLATQYDVPVRDFYKNKNLAVDDTQLHRAGYDAQMIRRVLYACLGLDAG